MTIEASNHRPIAHWVKWLQNWRVLGHSLLRSLVRSIARTTHSSACSALLALLASLRCAYSLTRSLAHSLTPELMRKIFLSLEWTRRCHIISTHSASSYWTIEPSRLSDVIASQRSATLDWVWGKCKGYRRSLLFRLWSVSIAQNVAHGGSAIDLWCISRIWFLWEVLVFWSAS